MTGQAGTEDLLYAFVKEALLTKASGISTKLYDQLLAEVRRLKSGILGAGINQDPSTVDQFVALLSATTRSITAVHERRHEVLLTELLDTPLWRVPGPVRLAVLDLLTHAVVANAALVQTCLHTIVYSLVPPPAPATGDSTPGEPWIPQPEQIAVQDDVLKAAEKVLQLVPSAAPRTLPLLVANLPHKLRPRNCHCLYLRALFRLAESPIGPALREGILAGVIEHLIAVDVDIKWEDIAEPTVADQEIREEPVDAGKHHSNANNNGGNNEQEPDIFELEGMTELELAMADGLRATKSPTPSGGRGGWEGSCAKTTTPPPPTSHGGSQQQQQQNTTEGAAPVVAVDETADKLDSLMELTLAHLDRRISLGQLESAWETTLACFERCVLPTHRSKFTQFLVFHLAGKAPEPCCRGLISLLLTRIGDKQAPPITRSASAAYAASFLARAAYVPGPLLVESLHRLLEWCLRYAREEDCRGGLAPIPSMASVASLTGDNGRHAAFYASFQALLYVLCYHMEPLLRLRGADAGSTGDVLTNGGGFAAMQVHRQSSAAACAEAVRRLVHHDLPKLLSHSLDPLGSCATSVVVEFSRQAWTLGFPSVSRQIRDWERQRTANGIKQMRPLEVFFPFDPYLLRRSASAMDLSSKYVHWRRGHVALPGDDATQNDDDDDEVWGGSDDAMSDGEMASDDEELSDSSSDDSSDTSSSSSSSSDSDSSSSESEDDDMKRTRFGSMPSKAGSSMSDGSFGGARRGRFKRHQRLPGALKASLMHGGVNGGSPTMGIAVPGSLSTDNNTGGSPWGMSPVTGGMGSFAPMSFGR